MTRAGWTAAARLTGHGARAVIRYDHRVKAARRDVADVPEQVGFYERMLPPREKPLDALGGILNGLGAGFGILALYWWPLFLGATGIGLAGMSLVFARERGIQSRFAWGFAIAGLGWLIGMMLGVYGHKPLSP
jgi:hypothetical protein